jgi:hypothetical protein
MHGPIAALIFVAMIHAAYTVPTVRISVLPCCCAAVNVVCGSPHRTHRTCVQSKHTAPRMSTFQLPHTQSTAPATASCGQFSASISASAPTGAIREPAGSWPQRPAVQMPCSQPCSAHAWAPTFSARSAWLDKPVLASAYRSLSPVLDFAVSVTRNLAIPISLRFPRTHGRLVLHLLRAGSARRRDTRSFNEDPYT